MSILVNMRLQPDYNQTPAPLREAYETLRNTILAAGIKTLVVTSAAPVEDRTGVAYNLAACMASGGLKALLVDCDLRKPRVHKIAHINGFPGITNCLVKRQRIAEVIQTDSVHGFDIIPCGPLPPSPADLFATSDMEDFFRQVKTAYDVIILDTPAASVTTEAALLGRYTDGVLITAQYKSTPVSMLKLAQENLINGGVNLLGCVIVDNNTRAVRTAKAYYEYYSPKTQEDAKTKPDQKEKRPKNEQKSEADVQK